MFTTIDEIVQDDLLVEITSRQVYEKTMYSFAVFKTFEKDGRTCRTSFLLPRHIARLPELLEQVSARIRQAQEGRG